MRILIVDDELNVLDGLKRMLSSITEVTQMEFCSSGEIALEKLKSTAFDLIICDLQMPGVNGVQVLEHVRRLSPETIRFILTGMIDHPLHHAALRLSHQLIAKPCRPELLRELIVRAIRLKNRLKQSELSGVLAKLQTLPSLPQVYQRVIEYLAQPKASCRGLSRLIGEDIGMSARLMQLANSAYYGRPGKVNNPTQAVVYLGMQTVEAMILREGIFSKIDAELAERFAAAALEAHCLRVGVLAKRICTDLALPAEMTERALMAGILHDTGKIIMIVEFAAQFEQALQKSRAEKIELFAAERQICGFTHAELGATLLSLWSLPAEIIETAAFHHVPWLLAGPDRPGRTLCMADVIYIADCIDHQYCSSRSDGYTFSIIDAYLNEFGLADRYRQWQAEHLLALQQEFVYAQERQTLTADC